jgi:hypothetical protein
MVVGDAANDGFKDYPDDFERQPSGSDPFAVEHNPNTHSSMVIVPVKLRDQASEITLSLRPNGLEYIQMEADPMLTAALDTLARANKLSTETIALVRQRLEGRTIPLSGDASLLVVHVATSGLMMRAVGPNQTATHGHSWNPIAHSDQNVQGYPLKRLMAGFAPLLFHWRYSPVKLLNLWIPIQPVKCQPLVLMDAATIAQSNQLHYHIYAKDKFLGERLNDCWVFTHNSSQQWWWRSNFGNPESENVTDAVLFSTLHTPHTSTTLPGEELLQPLWHGLRLIGQKAQAKAQTIDTGAVDTVGTGTAPRLSCGEVSELLLQTQQAADSVRHALLWDADPDVKEPLTPPVRDTMRQLLDMHESIKNTCGSADNDTTTAAVQHDVQHDVHAYALEAHAVTDRVIRKSLEMRLVAIQMPSRADTARALFLFAAIAASFGLTRDLFGSANRA